MSFEQRLALPEKGSKEVNVNFASHGEIIDHTIDDPFDKPQYENQKSTTETEIWVQTLAVLAQPPRRMNRLFASSQIKMFCVTNLEMKPNSHKIMIEKCVVGLIKNFTTTLLQAQ